MCSTDCNFECTINSSTSAYFIQKSIRISFRFRQFCVKGTYWIAPRAGLQLLAKSEFDVHADNVTPPSL
jgi:hypothetical protein